MVRVYQQIHFSFWTQSATGRLKLVSHRRREQRRLRQHRRRVAGWNVGLTKVRRLLLHQGRVVQLSSPLAEGTPDPLRLVVSKGESPSQPEKQKQVETSL